jgi:hypothetical protein
VYLASISTQKFTGIKVESDSIEVMLAAPLLSIEAEEAVAGQEQDT